MAPSVMLSAPRIDFILSFSPKKMAAKNITNTMLKRSMADTFEASPAFDFKAEK